MTDFVDSVPIAGAEYWWELFMDSSVFIRGIGESAESDRCSGRSPAARPEMHARPFDAADDPAEVTNLLGPQEQELLQLHASVLDHRCGGKTLFCEGKDADFLYLISRGMVQLSRCAENGHRQLLAFKRSGDICGLPDAGRYSRSARTLGPVVLFRISWQRMRQLMAANARLQLCFLTKVVFDARQTELRMMTLAQQNIYQRLAAFVLELMRPPSSFEGRRQQVTLPVNRSDLADYLGTAPESISRAFSRLESERLLKRVGPRTLEILDVSGLEEFCAGCRRAESGTIVRSSGAQSRRFHQART